jgi:N-methylhydantoinase B
MKTTQATAPHTPASPQVFDPVGLGILWDRLVSMTNEVVEVLVRTSFSTIVRENYDLACMLFDAQGQILAQGSLSQPVFIGTGPQTVRQMLKKFPPETLKPGDVLFTNDAWIGTGHLWDVNVLRPVFKGDRLVAYTLSISHLPDIGGRGISAENNDIYEEGLQIPVCKLFRAGERNEELVDLIRQNVRVSEQVIGDLMANVACTEVGERLLLEFMQEYGLNDLGPLASAILNQSEQAMRAQIAAIPDGVYANTIHVEAFDEPVRLSARVTIRGDRLSIDYSGTSAQIRAGINVPLCYTRAMSCYAVKCLTIPGIPNNEGSVRPVELVAPEGCILNAQPPAATGARLLVGHFVAPLLFGAFAEALPDRVQADPGMMNALNVMGRRLDGRPFSSLYFSSGGLGAMRGLDGQSATPAPANMKTMSAEIWESLTNLTLLERRLLIDSGGAGEFRGGLGQRLVLRNDTAEPVYVAILGSRTEYPALGYAGGLPAAARRYLVRGEPVHAKGRYMLKPGELITIEDSGGGGFGDPRKRPADKVAADVEAGFVSVGAARGVYGAAI